MVIPTWAKTTGMFLIVMICWDVVRLFLQAWVNRLFMRKEFKKLDEAIEDVEEAVEDKNEKCK